MSGLRGDAAEYHVRGVLAWNEMVTLTGSDYLPYDLAVDVGLGKLVYL